MLATRGPQESNSPIDTAVEKSSGEGRPVIGELLFKGEKVI